MSRDVLAPPLQRMGKDRSYRVNLVHDDFGGHPARQGLPQKAAKQGYVEPDLYDEDDDGEEENFTVEELPNSQLKLKMHVPESFFGGIIGFKGSTKRRIESETQTEIHVPRGRGGDHTISITGKTRSSVCTARRKITLLTASLRNRTKPTHFLGVALNYGEIQENFIKFKETILAENFPGIVDELFVETVSIHITIGVCVLLDDVERNKGVEILQSLKDQLSDLKTPFDFKVKGLEIMNDDPSAARVLYAVVDAPEFQKFADRAVQKFIDCGYSRRENNNVKLHMTLMKSSKLEDKNVKFDVREILKRYGDYHFGSTQCNEILLCVLGGGDRSQFYKTTGSLKI